MIPDEEKTLIVTQKSTIIEIEDRLANKFYTIHPKDISFLIKEENYFSIHFRFTNFFIEIPRLHYGINNQNTERDNEFNELYEYLQEKLRIYS